MKKKIIAFVVATILVLGLFTWNSCNAQTRFSIGGGAMIAPTGAAFSGIANAGYEVTNFSANIDLRSAPKNTPAWLGLTVGYNILKGDNPVRLYTGYWKRFTGNKSKVDRNHQNGQTIILSTNKEVDTNGWDYGGGVQCVLVEHIMLDVSYVRQMHVAILFTGLIK